MRIAADQEVPHPKAAPVVDGGDPAAGGLVLSLVHVVLFTLDLEKCGLSVCEPYQVVRFVVMIYPIVLIRYEQKWRHVPDVTEDMVGLLLEVKGGCLFPRTVQHHGIDVRPLGAVHVSFRGEVNVCRCPNWFEAIENRLNRRLAPFPQDGLSRS
jgi:hypothetical protein